MMLCSEYIHTSATSGRHLQGHCTLILYRDRNHHRPCDGLRIYQRLIRNSAYQVLSERFILCCLWSASQNENISTACSPSEEMLAEIQPPHHFSERSSRPRHCQGRKTPRVEEPAMTRTVAHSRAENEAC